MLHAERGGEQQIADELRAYNPLLPQGNDIGKRYTCPIQPVRGSSSEHPFLATS